MKHNPEERKHMNLDDALLLALCALITTLLALGYI